MKSLSNIEHYRKLIELEIGKQRYGKHPEALYEPMRYLMRLGGKRLRPLLTVLTYALFKRDVKSVVPYATAVELFHNFTLMHDDIMDHSPLRRGKETVHTRWDMATAILSGDAMLVKVYEQFLKLPAAKLHPVLEAFNRCALGVCEGQRLDMDFETRKHVTEDDYLEMIRLKTAVLLGFSMELGCLLCNAPRASSAALYRFGVNLGIGFQLQDDWLDVYGDPGKIGKQGGGDIITNKKTLLLIHAFTVADKKTRAALQEWLDAKEFDPEEKIRSVRRIFDRLSVRDWMNRKMTGIFNRGFAGLAKSGGDVAAKNRLIEFSRSLIDRQS